MAYRLDWDAEWDRAFPEHAPRGSVGAIRPLKSPAMRGAISEAFARQAKDFHVHDMILLDDILAMALRIRKMSRPNFQDNEIIGGRAS